MVGGAGAVAICQKKCHPLPFNPFAGECLYIQMLYIYRYRYIDVVYKGQTTIKQAQTLVANMNKSQNILLMPTGLTLWFKTQYKSLEHHGIQTFIKWLTYQLNGIASPLFVGALRAYCKYCICQGTHPLSAIFTKKKK